MRAMILAAGLGTRLRPLTLVRPKVLTPLMGTTVLDYWVYQLSEAGCDAVILNAYHLSEELTSAIEGKEWPIPVHVRKEPVLLETGGGLRNVLDFFQDEPLIAINGDIVCNIALRSLYNDHIRSRIPVSMVLHDFPQFNNVAVDDSGRILQIGNEAISIKATRPDIRLLAFTGIHFIDPAVLAGLTPGVPEGILTVYRALIEESRSPQALVPPDLYWREMGSIESYLNLNKEITQLPEGALKPLQTGRPGWIHPEAIVDDSACLKGLHAVGRGTHIMADAELEDTIIWDRAVIGPSTRLRNCIVTDGTLVEGVHENEIITSQTR